MTEVKANNLDLARILDDPTNFLHSIDVEGDVAFFLRTDPQLLRDASFIDGRVSIATMAPAPIPLSELIAAAEPSVATDRFLFNCSFCGSTLLARLLDVPGKSLVLKEPRCLTDIAGWKTTNSRDGRASDRLRPLLDLARAALRRPFTPGEAITVKVASQGNALLDTLAEDVAHVRPIFLTISRVGFLRAVFRGGVKRMHYATKIAWLMAADVPNGDFLLREAVSAGVEPLRKAANLAILAHDFQIILFQRAVQVAGWNDDHVIDYDEIARSPHEAAVKAAGALDLGLSDNDIARNVARLANRNSKRPIEPFSNDEQRLADHRLHSEHSQVFEDALAWAETALGPQRAVVPESDRRASQSQS
jgi:hypothetical protein